MRREYNSIDLFAGCGGLTQGMRAAGFKVNVAVEVDAYAAGAYIMNHPETSLLQKDIRCIDPGEIREILGNNTLHLLAGCPPCQGFSSVRKLNRKESVGDKRNNLVLEYFRFVKELRPLTIMLENVSGLKDYQLFKNIIKELDGLGYRVKIKIVNVKNYGVPQNRRRLVMVGSLLGDIDIAVGTSQKITVRDVLFEIEKPDETQDELHKILPTHTQRVRDRIKITPKNGGSRKDLPGEYTLECHKKENVGFNDIYGRLRWDDYSTTITGGCLNPSKGRFLHPDQDRVITPREAALLQSFPKDYKFPLNIPKHSLALLIGNALPPKFSKCQSENIVNHLNQYIID